MASSPSKIARAGTLLIKKLGPGAVMPTRGSPAAAGLDLFAAADTVRRMEWISNTVVCCVVWVMSHCGTAEAIVSH